MTTIPLVTPATSCRPGNGVVGQVALELVNTGSRFHENSGLSRRSDEPVELALSDGSGHAGRVRRGARGPDSWRTPTFTTAVSRLWSDSDLSAPAEVSTLVPVIRRMGCSIRREAGAICSDPCWRRCRSEEVPSRSLLAPRIDAVARRPAPLCSSSIKASVHAHRGGTRSCSPHRAAIRAMRARVPSAVLGAADPQQRRTE